MSESDGPGRGASGNGRASRPPSTGSAAPAAPAAPPAPGATSANLPAVYQPPVPPAIGVLKAVPGLARVATVSAWNAMNWSVHATRTSANYIAKRAVDGEPPAAIVQEAANDLPHYG